MREPWQRINAVVREALTQVTLADLATPALTGQIIELSELGVDLGEGA